MWILIVALLLGCLCGIVTGLIPGIHTNTVAILALAGLPFLSQYLPLLAIGVFFISMVLVHSFLDFIPSIFLGAPEAATALSVLPGHNLLLNGEGYKALKLTVVGGVGTFLVGLALLPLFFLFLKRGYPYLSLVIAPLLIIFSALFILKERGIKKVWALAVFLLAGVLGLVVLNKLNVQQPLFPLLSGIFGVSTLIISILSGTQIVEQKLDAHVEFLGWSRFFNYIKAAISSAIVSVMPAIGAAQAAIIARGFVRFKKPEDFLVVLGGINTVAGLFTLTSLYLVNKARTGVIAALQQIMTLDLHAYLILLATAFTAVGIAVVLTLKIGKIFAKNISRINYQWLSLGIIFLICALVFLLCGPLGLLVVSVAAAIGLIAPNVGIKRIHAMGCLVLPVVFYFI